MNSALGLLTRYGLSKRAGAPPVDPFGVISRDNGGEGTATSSITIPLPAGRAPGRLMLIIFRTSTTSSTTHSTPAGWNLIATAQYGTGGRTSVFTRVATGSESPTITITLNASREAAWATYLIGGAHGAASVEAASTTLNFNPPSLTPSWGAAPNLWLAVATCNRTDTIIATTPANYGNAVTGVSTPSVSNATACQVVSSERILNAASEDPANYGSYSLPNPVSFTVAVRPSP